MVHYLKGSCALPQLEEICQGKGSAQKGSSSKEEATCLWTLKRHPTVLRLEFGE